METNKINLEDVTFEKAIARLEEIVKALENGSAPLDQSLELFEEANSLAVFCKKCLDSAEQKIVRLTEDGSEENDFE